MGVDEVATGSDIDLCVTTPRPADHAAQVKMLNALSVALRESHLTKTTLVIRHARVPLVSFETIPELGKPLALHAWPEADRCICRLVQVRPQHQLERPAGRPHHQWLPEEHAGAAVSRARRQELLR